MEAPRQEHANPSDRRRHRGPVQTPRQRRDLVLRRRHGLAAPLRSNDVDDRQHTKLRANPHMRRREVIDVAPDQSSLRNTLPPLASKDFVRWRPSTEHFGSTAAETADSNADDRDRPPSETSNEADQHKRAHIPMRRPPSNLLSVWLMCLS